MAFDEVQNSIRIVDFEKFSSNFGLLPSGYDDHTLRSMAFDEPAALADQAVTYPQQRFEAVEKYYIHTQQDRIISPESQAAIAQSMNLAGEATLPTGHSPMVAEPAALAEIIMRFVGAES